MNKRVVVDINTFCRYIELGVLMKFHYRKGFGNPVVVSEADTKLGKIRKQASKMALPFGSGISERPGVLALDRGYLDDSRAVIKVKILFGLHRDISA